MDQGGLNLSINLDSNKPKTSAPEMELTRTYVVVSGESSPNNQQSDADCNVSGRKTYHDSKHAPT